MIALDTSVVVAAFASWHEAHSRASAVLARRPRLPAHVLIETYSVLTRLPPPHRAPAAVVDEFLQTTFPLPPLALPGGAHRSLVGIAAAAGIAGGAVYDALVALTAKRAKAKLLTFDRRAVPAYEAVGVDYEFLE
ncbi:MAG TPA: PIN domain-containing protein [Thermoanaerobaculia bacterium]|nr:PIN domain-containing protein [Thermoanaerobaculia bacterium]